MKTKSFFVLCMICLLTQTSAVMAQMREAPSSANIRLQKDNGPFQFPSDPKVVGPKLNQHFEKIPSPCFHVENKLFNLYCPDISPTPPPVTAQQSLLSNIFKEYTNQCSSAATALIEKIESNVSLYAPEAKKVLSEYDQKCMKVFNPTNTSYEEHISNQIGVLWDENEDAFFCAATLISKTHILTARHCLYADEGLSQQRNISGIRFIPYKTPNDALAVSEYFPAKMDWENLPPRPTDHKHDYLIFALKSPYTSAQTLPAAPVIAIGERLSIPAMNIGIARLDIAADPYRANDRSNGRWKKWIRHDDAATCRIADIRDGVCLLHNCQTLLGMSGAGVFVERNGRPALAAIHIGTPASEGGGARCLQKEKDIEVNLARIYTARLQALAK